MFQNNNGRIVIFAHWDKDNLIDDYVIYYLNALKNIANIIIFSSDCDIKDTELKKLENITPYIISKCHGEYDFGSYKRGYVYAQRHNLLKNAEELLICNDSCIGPFHPLEDIFEEMKNNSCDFWGLNYNKYITSHLQSFFLVFKKNVFNSKQFEEFLLNVRIERNKNIVVKKYELNFTEYLLQAGFNYSYCFDKPIPHRLYSTIFSEMGNTKYPFIKKSMLNNYLNKSVSFFVNKMRKNIYCNYPFEIIEKYYERINRGNIQSKFVNFIKLWVSYYIIFPRTRDRLYFINKWYYFNK